MANDNRKQLTQSDKERCARWLEELEVNQEGIEIILQMRQQMFELQERVRQLESELGVHRQHQARRVTLYRESYYEATWREIEEKDK